MPIEKIKDLVAKRQIEWKRHALKRLFERGIKRQEVFEAIGSGEIIETYKEDKPFSSYLVLGYSKGKPLHIVLSLDNDEPMVFIITVYIPSPLEWEDGWKVRRNK